MSLFAYQFTKDLVDWYESEQRDLPWRRSRDPYRIWISEVMLQQTRVDTVIPYYENFLKKFPTLPALANAHEDEVLKAWEGLGYYSRARNLHGAVKEIAASYDGVVPNDPDKFRELKGVGPYTGGAVMSIAYDFKEPAVDGNVMRVLSRVLYITEDISKQKTRKQFEEHVREYLEMTEPSKFNQALMELGALICKPKKPDCEQCPVSKLCLAREKGVVEQLPIKAKKAKPKDQQVSCAVIVDENERVLIEQRPKEGLLAGLWQFPAVLGHANDLSSVLHDQYKLDLPLQKESDVFKHVFSHLKWEVSVYTGTIATEEEHQGVWVNKHEFQSYSFPVVYQKIAKHYLDGDSSSLLMSVGRMLSISSLVLCVPNS
ncbi:A/G-specific adenine glycosylase [Geomicrobium sp. JCM 19038]|uniref:A/G-specific adenine glycosylase n=1 Tax=Geomicrobium sp. JCM 19038 TaxID=1460635 RepID=UPI00045F32EF|nr:A/G-specific adenine glycosylase [Geomicrobium sp. JCM 19038]GAK10320.1 A/G-specific adenine glycosylase [Geomicrobium sp. JCM 19038]